MCNCFPIGTPRELLDTVRRCRYVALSLPLASMPNGPGLGNLVKLEVLDFSGNQWREAFQRACQTSWIRLCRT